MFMLSDRTVATGSRFRVRFFACPMLALLVANLTLADGQVGPARRVTIDHCRRKLADVDQDPFPWLAALDKLELSPSEGVPIYTDLLADPRNLVREESLRKLKNYGAQAKQATRAILAIFEDAKASPSLRTLAVRSLSSIAPTDAAVIRSCRVRLTNTETPIELACGAIDCVAAAGEMAAAAAPQLKEWLQHSDTATQHAAYCAIGRIRTERPPSIDALHRVDDSTPFRGENGYSWFRAVEDAGPKAGNLIPVLVRLSQRKDIPLYLRGMALKSLGAIDADDPRVVRSLLGGVASGDSFLSHVAKRELAKLDGSRVESAAPLAKGLKHGDLEVRRQSAGALRKLGPRAVSAIPGLCLALRACDGETDQYLVAAYLDAIRAMGRHGRGAAETLSAVLAQNSALYRNRDKWDVVRLRSYVLVVLSEIGMPKSAVPYLIDSLANTDDRRLTYEVGAAARAAGAFGETGRPLTPWLTTFLDEYFFEDEFSLERYDPNYPQKEATTVRIEVIRALGKIRPVDNELVVRLLTKYAKNRPQSSRQNPRVSVEAQKALKAIRDARRSSKTKALSVRQLSTGKAIK